MSEEHWRVIPDFPEYSVSSVGNVRRDVGGRGAVPGRILKTHVGSTGYRVVQLWREQKRHTYAVHRLVALSFIPEIPGKPQVAHNDGNRLNNQVSNLRWVDQFENMADSRNHGTMALGSRNGLSKLNEEKIREIRELARAGLSVSEISEKFRVVPQTIVYVLKRVTWKHVA